MSNYPAGAESNPRAPYNQPPTPHCRECEQTIHREGNHEQGCLNEGMSAGELCQQREEDAKVERAERRMEEQRIESRSQNGGDSA